MLVSDVNGNTLAVRDTVTKVTGDYQLDGVLVSIFTTTCGDIRVVVEHERGYLHIYNTNQIVLKTRGQYEI